MSLVSSNKGASIRDAQLAQVERRHKYKQKVTMYCHWLIMFHMSAFSY